MWWCVVCEVCGVWMSVVWCTCGGERMLVKIVTMRDIGDRSVCLGVACALVRCGEVVFDVGVVISNSLQVYSKSTSYSSLSK